MEIENLVFFAYVDWCSHKTKLIEKNNLRNKMCETIFKQWRGRQEGEGEIEWHFVGPNWVKVSIMGWYQSRFPKGNHGQEFQGRRGTKGREKGLKRKRERERGED